MARGRQRPRDALELDQVRPRVAPKLDPPLEHRAETSAGPDEKICSPGAPDRCLLANPRPPRVDASPLTLPPSTPSIAHDATAQDFYEHLCLSEKIVRGRVELELPHPETSDGEEEMWSKWEARNRERFGRQRMVRDREGLESRARALGPIGELELRELTRRNGGSERREPESPGSSSARGDAATAAARRRRPRSAADATYASLLSRSRRNSERVEEAFRKSDQARVDEAIALRDSPDLKGSLTGTSRSPGSGGRGRGRGSPRRFSFPRRSDSASPASVANASSSRKTRLSIPLDSKSEEDAFGSDSNDDVTAMGWSSDENAENARGASPGKSSGGSAEPRRRRFRSRSRAASVSGFPTTHTPSLRASAAKALRARSASPPRRDETNRNRNRVGPRTGSGRSVSPGSPAASRALALALAENDAVLAAAGYDVPGGSRAPPMDAVAFGQHWTTHGEAARARKARRERDFESAERAELGDETNGLSKKFSARATTTFRPPRLYTSSRPDERVRTRAATARAWAKQELTEAVVLRAVGPVYGEPGVARHWDDPTRAAAEQAAAKTRSESLLTHGDARLAHKAARAAGVLERGRRSRGRTRRNAPFAFRGDGFRRLSRRGRLRVLRRRRSPRGFRRVGVRLESDDFAGELRRRFARFERRRRRLPSGVGRARREKREP